MGDLIYMIGPIRYFTRVSYIQYEPPSVACFLGTQIYTRRTLILDGTLLFPEQELSDSYTHLLKVNKWEI